MAVSPSELEQELRRLPHRERARLAALLLASLESVEEGNVVDVWLEEAERRLTDLESGQAQAIPLEEMLAEVRRGFR